MKKLVITTAILSVFAASAAAIYQQYANPTALMFSVGFLPSETIVTYGSPAYGFSIGYPEGYTVDESYAYNGLGPAPEIPGVAFTIPKNYWDGTNLGSDTRVDRKSVV